MTIDNFENSSGVLSDPDKMVNLFIWRISDPSARDVSNSTNCAMDFQ